MGLCLGGGVDVFGLGHAAQIVLVAGQAAEEDATAHGQDSGTPAKAVSPGVVVVALEYEVLVKLDRVDDEGNDLHDDCEDDQETDERCQGDVERAAEGDAGDDEGDDEEDETDDHQSCHCLGP